MAVEQTAAPSVSTIGDDLVKRARAARDAGTAWMLERISADGEAVGARERPTYYRIPWTLAVAGERETAGAVLSWAERNALTPDGDLRPGAAQAGFTHRWSSYPLAILALGAWHLERDDTALAIMRVLRDFQDPESGGAYAERPDTRTSTRQDLFPTAQLGMTALTTGHREAADGAFRWLASLYQAQPELPRRLYTAWDENGLITEPDEGLEFEVVTDLEKPRQAFYNPGIAAAFLARYFMQTGDQQARDLGRAYLRLSAEGTEAQFDHAESKQICKFGWGASLMLLADPEGDHLRHVVRMTEWFIDSQLEDGRWQNSPFLTPEPSEAGDMSVTAEFVLHLTTILTALGGWQRAPIAAE
jgi:hypothetical protein